MKPMNVARLWWELTKFVLQGRGRYEVGLYLENVDEHHFEIDDPNLVPLGKATWEPVRVDWWGGRDRFATIVARPDDPAYFLKPVSPP